MWKAPNRNNKKISQTFNNGIVKICAVSDAALPGLKPVEKLREKVQLRFEEQRLGIQRYYSGKQNQIEIERVIRTPNYGMVNTQDVAIVDGKQYRIDLVQLVKDVYPPSIDLTLFKITQNYEIEEGEK